MDVSTDHVQGRGPRSTLSVGKSTGKLAQGLLLRIKVKTKVLTMKQILNTC